MLDRRVLWQQAVHRARARSGRCVRWYSQQQPYGNAHPYGQTQQQQYMHPQQGHPPQGYPEYPPQATYSGGGYQQPPPQHPQHQQHQPPPPQQQHYASPPPPQQGSWHNPLVISQAPSKAFLEQISHALNITIMLSFLWLIYQGTFVVESEDGSNNGNSSQQRDGSANNQNGRSDTPAGPEAAPPASGGGFGMLMGRKEKVKPVDLSSVNHAVKFSDILGCDEAKGELLEVCQFLKNPDKFTRLGGRLPKGYMLVGPPGTGKTMLAKAIAKEADVPFFYTSGAQFEEKFVGVGSKRVRELFEAAREKSPCLIFIDEIDAVGGKRSRQDASHDRATINQLLSEMDGFASSEGIVVIAATNSPNTLDKALTRPGRFDRQVSVAPPDLKGRIQILEHYLTKVTSDPKLDPKSIARGTGGMTGADLSNVVNIATISAAKRNLEYVTLECMEEAKDRVTMGIAHRSKKIPQHERENTAYHEAGHALVAMFSDQATVLHKATIIPRGQSLGVTQQLPPDYQVSMSLSQMKNRLKVLMGGRIAEEVVFGRKEVTSGASNDLQQATTLARSMVRKYGLSTDLGCVDYSFADDPQGIFLSNKTRQQIEEEVKKLVDQAHTEAYQLITDKREVLNQIAKGLLENETLSGQEMRRMAKLPEPEQEKAP